MSVVQEFRDREIARLERSGWVTNKALRRRLEAVGLRPPAEVVAQCLDEGTGIGGEVGARWARAERAVARLRECFAPFRFSDDVDYGLLAIPTVDPALGEGADLAASTGTAGTTLGKDGWMVVAGVVGLYGISAGSHEDVTAAPAELFEVDGVDTRALMTRQI